MEHQFTTIITIITIPMCRTPAGRKPTVARLVSLYPHALMTKRRMAPSVTHIARVVTLASDPSAGRTVPTTLASAMTVPTAISLTHMAAEPVKCIR